MKKIDIFYLFLLVLIALYYFYCEYKEKENIEGFLSNSTRRELYEKYYGEFKNDSLQYSDYSNDLDLFVQATEALTDQYTGQEKPDIKPYANIEPTLPKAPKAKNIGISSASIDKYNVEPPVDTLTALTQELENVSNQLSDQQNEPYPDETLISDLTEQYNGIQDLINQEKENPSS
tara:strand:+ start:395 stop:922 length:528 start_codon:yes stop_codon:yes gene_type:complete